jgi:formiminotetrahydrofolate cyclodeaminase
MADDFLTKLARPQPDPGGGAAAAHGACLGLALLEKVLRLEARRRPNPAGEPPAVWEETLGKLHRLTEDLARLREEDVRAYFGLTAARASGDAVVLAAALQEAVDCPRRIARQACQALELLAWAGDRCRPHLVSDLLVAAEFLAAACRGALHIAQANLPLLSSGEARRSLAKELRRFYREGNDLYQRVQSALLIRIGPQDCPDI